LSLLVFQAEGGEAATWFFQPEMQPSTETHQSKAQMIEANHLD